MYYSNIDFNKISQALSNSMEMIQSEQSSSPALEHLTNAKEELQQALSFLSTTYPR